jgi:hypothetical protein
MEGHLVEETDVVKLENIQKQIVTVILQYTC